MAEYISNGESALSIRGKLNDSLITPAEFSYSGNVVSITAPENAKHIEFFATTEYSSSYTYNLNGQGITLKNFFNPEEEVYWGAESIVHMVYNDSVWYVLSVPQKASEDEAVDFGNDKKYITPKTAKLSFDKNIDNFFKVGDIRMSGRDLEAEDSRYFTCDGRSVSPSSYPELAEAISGRFGYPASMYTLSSFTPSSYNGAVDIYSITGTGESGLIAFTARTSYTSGTYLYYYYGNESKKILISNSDGGYEAVGIFYVGNILYYIGYSNSQEKTVIKKINNTIVTDIYSDTDIGTNAKIRSVKVEGDTAYVSIECNSSSYSCMLLKINGDSVAKKGYGNYSYVGYGSFILGDYVYYTDDSYSTIRRVNIKTFGNAEVDSNSEVRKFFNEISASSWHCIEHSSRDGSSVAICNYSPSDNDSPLTGKYVHILEYKEGNIKYRKIEIMVDIMIPSGYYRSTRDLVLYKSKDRYSGYVVSNNSGQSNRIITFFDEYNGCLKATNYLYYDDIRSGTSENIFSVLDYNRTAISVEGAGLICYLVKYTSGSTSECFPIQLVRKTDGSFYIPNDNRNSGEIRSYIKAKN